MARRPAAVLGVFVVLVVPVLVALLVLVVGNTCSASSMYSQY